MGVRVLRRLAHHVEENLGHWGRKGHKRERNQAIALALRRVTRESKYRASPSLFLWRGTLLHVTTFESQLSKITVN